jgi:DNA mismatch repair protein MutL
VKIEVLPEDQARRIAAGEVIERPAAALRELIDNAIDANAAHIHLLLKDGGIQSLTIVDDGEGMERDDLERCILPHATSKIRCVEDLDNSYTLGFRGEALASLATCSYLEIISKTELETGYRLTAIHSQLASIEPAASPKGTTVCVREIFHNLPARKRFLKSPSTEGRECLNIFLEKALAFPHIDFKFIIDEKVKYHLLPCTQAQRVLQIYAKELGADPIVAFSSQTMEEDGLHLQIVSSQNHHYRHDKRYLHLYVNGRRIMEYAPIQALIQAYDAILPGGQFPVGFIFLQLRADLVDFNVHPAKREAKFRNMPIIHKAITMTLRPKLISDSTSVQNSHVFRPLAQHEFINMPIAFSVDSAPVSPIQSASHQHFRVSSVRSASTSPVAAIKASSAPHKRTAQSAISLQKIPQAEIPWHFMGQAFGVFLLVEQNKSLFLIDQHAAHERILFDELCARPPISQRLLSPIMLDLNADEYALMVASQKELTEMGVLIELEEGHKMHILAAPEGLGTDFWHAYLENLGNGWHRALFATMACRTAVKEGDYLDDEAAKVLVEQAFARLEPFCPHGRPLWIELTRDQLYHWIKRLV